MNHVHSFRSTMLFLVIGCVSTFASAQDDIASREAAADRYLRAVPMAKMLDDAFSQMGKQLAPDQRAQFASQMKRVVRADFLEQITRESMVRTFTADELNALADFYGSRHGSSAALKFGVYIAEVMPAIQAEVQRGQQALFGQQK